jgi:hypothetical protein
MCCCCQVGSAARHTASRFGSLAPLTPTLARTIGFLLVY